MKLLITSNIPEKIYDELDKNFEISYHDSNVPLSKEEIIEMIKMPSSVLFQIKLTERSLTLATI